MSLSAQNSINLDVGSGTTTIDSNITADLANDFGDKTVYLQSDGQLVAKKIAHGYWYVEDSTTVINIASGSTWYHIGSGSLGYNWWINGENGPGVTMTNDTLTLEHTGHWRFAFKVTIEGDASEEFRIRMYNVTKDEGLKVWGRHTGDGNNDPVSLHSISYCDNCEADDKIVIQIYNAANGDPNCEIWDGYIDIFLEHTDGK